MCNCEQISTFPDMDTLGLIILGVFGIVSFICALILGMKYKNTLECKIANRGPLHLQETVDDIKHMIVKSVDSSGIDGLATTYKMFYLMTVLASLAEDMVEKKKRAQIPFLPMRIARPGLEVVVRIDNT